MAQFECPVCGQGFEQQSRLERHMETSHPPRAPSAADLEHALAGINFPASRSELVAHAEKRASKRAEDETGDRPHDTSAPSAEAVTDVLRELPDRRYRDAAEVARALGQVRRHEEKPEHQPSRLGGERAARASGGPPSSARLASLLEGIDFPASEEELAEHARARATPGEMAVVERLDGGPWEDMADVMRAYARLQHKEQASGA